MPCSTITSLAISASSFAYFTVRNTSHVYKSPIPSRASLARYSLYKLNKIGENQHPYLTPFPLFTLIKFWKKFKDPRTTNVLVINISMSIFVICICDLIRYVFWGMLSKLSQNLLCCKIILPVSERIQ